MNARLSRRLGKIWRKVLKVMPVLTLEQEAELKNAIIISPSFEGLPAWLRDIVRSVEHSQVSETSNHKADSL